MNGFFSSVCPVAIDIFEGNTADPKMLEVQIEKLRPRFGLSRGGAGDRPGHPDPGHTASRFFHFLHWKFDPNALNKGVEEEISRYVPTFRSRI